jgi:LPXTG-motif cell wall-anchored protein
MLKDLYRWTFADGQWIKGAQAWDWQHGAQYVFYELPGGENQDYVFGSFQKIERNGYLYKHDDMDSFTINSVNLRKAWDISLLKVSDDSRNSKLAGAWFGLYSMKEPTEEVVIPDGLTQEISETIDYADPEGVVQTFYLTDIRMSDHTGIILWEDLTERQYLVQELQAPDGYNYDSKIHFVQRPADVEDYIEDLTVVNRSGYEMPKSGGIGTHWSMMAGILLMAASTVVLLATKRRKKDAKA